METFTYSLFGLPWKEARKTAVLGVAYDSTSELAKGAFAFPVAVRLASYTVEWPDVEASDWGDLLPPSEPEKMRGAVRGALGELWDGGVRRFLVLGGNHSVTVPVVEFLAEQGLKRYVHFDAHDDFRESWLGSRLSFACTLRRVAEVADVALVGVRSFSPGFEADFPVVRAGELSERREEVLKMVERADYVSVDMDVLSNQVTNPEPHSLMPLEYLLGVLGGRKIGGDIVEGVPRGLFNDPVAVQGALIAGRMLEAMK